MSKKAIEASLKAYPQKMQSIGSSWIDLNESDRMKYQAGYERAEAHARLDIAKNRTESWCNGYDEGYKTAKINLGWHSVEECLPEIDEEVIVLTDELNTAPIYKIAFGHIVNTERCIDYNGWNIPGVRYWMPCPKIPEE